MLGPAALERWWCIWGEGAFRFFPDNSCNSFLTASFLNFPRNPANSIATTSTAQFFINYLYLPSVSSQGSLYCQPFSKTCLAFCHSSGGESNATFVIKFLLLGSARLSTHPIVGPAWVDRWTLSRGGRGWTLRHIPA